MEISLLIPIYVVVILSLLSVLFAVSAGHSKAICDLSADDKIKESLPKEKWVKKYSSGNKVVESDSKIKAWFRKNLFVAFSDKWHLHQLITYSTFFLSGVCIGILMITNWWFSFLVLINYNIRSAVFHFYYHISKKYRKL